MQAIQTTYQPPLTADLEMQDEEATRLDWWMIDELEEMITKPEMKKADADNICSK